MIVLDTRGRCYVKTQQECHSSTESAQNQTPNLAQEQKSLPQIPQCTKWHN